MSDWWILVFVEKGQFMSDLRYLASHFEWKSAPLWFHLRGLSQTATGYGGKLTSRRMIRLERGTRWRRVYVACFSNSGTAYVLIKGIRYIVHDHDFSPANEVK